MQTKAMQIKPKQTKPKQTRTLAPLLGKQRGVSLIEFVLGIVILGIVLAGVSLFYAGQPQRLDAVFQFRAVSLAEALAEQVVSVQYDGNNDPSMQLRCGLHEIEGVPLPCNNAPYNPDEIIDGEVVGFSLQKFTALDDFNLWCDTPADGQLLASELGMPSPQLYSRFKVKTCVTKPAPPPLGLAATAAEYADHFKKEVTITLSIANSGDLSFVLHRYNIR